MAKGSVMKVQLAIVALFLSAACSTPPVEYGPKVDTTNPEAANKSYGGGDAHTLQFAPPPPKTPQPPKIVR